jgi:hypothetical protein
LYEGIRQPMTFRGRYLLIGRLELAAAVGLIGGNFFGGRGEVLKPDGGRVLTVMDFGQSFPLDPLPSADDTGNSEIRRPAHVVDSAMFCDSDDTASISYFAYVRLERR